MPRRAATTSAVPARAPAPRRAPPRRAPTVKFPRTSRAVRDPHVPAAARPLPWSHRELAVALCVVGFLALAVVLALDPARRLAESNDALRYSGVQTIAAAIMREQAATHGPFGGRESSPITYQPEGYVQVIVADDGAVDCANEAARPTCGAYKLDTSGHHTRCVADLSSLTPAQLAVIPVAPESFRAAKGGLPLGPSNSGYYVARRFGGQLEIGACTPETLPELAVEIL
jgi:hypothetical protein